MRIGQDLELDVVRLAGRIFRGRRGRRRTRTGLRGGRLRRPRPGPRAARRGASPSRPRLGRGLDQDRVSDAAGRRLAPLPASARGGVPGTMGTPALAMRSRARVFSPMSSMASGGGPMKTRPRSRQAAANAGVLAQEAVSGMDRVGARAGGDVEDLVLVEIRLPRADDPAGDRPRRPGGRGGPSGRDRRRRPPWRCPSSRHVRMMRTAISPRLAIRIFGSAGRA